MNASVNCCPITIEVIKKIKVSAGNFLFRKLHSYRVLCLFLTLCTLEVIRHLSAAWSPGRIQSMSPDWGRSSFLSRLLLSWRPDVWQHSVSISAVGVRLVWLLDVPQWLVFEKSSKGRGPLDPGSGTGPLAWGGWGEVVAAPPALLLLLLLPAGLGPWPPRPGPACHPSQQLEDVCRSAAAQVLPGFLPRRVPQTHVCAELGHQQAQDVLVAVDGCDVERRLAAHGPGVDVKAQTCLLHSIPANPARAAPLTSLTQPR